MKKMLLLFIKGYRTFISPFTPPSCRFFPSCSQYGMEAVQTHGAWKGLWLTVKRISKCHPFHPGGFDPVPPPKNRKEHDIKGSE
ncbi:membrane protein insertion efficiency factor YidD [Salibacterium lacus]|uniref:Putative membrane protein insertion efficiency factor n=1 Tax=Salibacterium lacus TaxID=1898109 RepID=A0ABW5SXS0_9BACI